MYYIFMGAILLVCAIDIYRDKINNSKGRTNETIRNT